MNQRSSHLTDRQIEEYVGQGSDDTPVPLRDHVEAHVANCSSCQGRVLEAERIQLGILKQNPGRPVRRPECPRREVLEEYAAGICSPEESSRVLQHAPKCDFCGPLLKSYLEDFSDEPTPEHKDLLDRLPVSQPQWQERFVRKNVIGHKTLVERLKNLFLLSPVGLIGAKFAIAGGAAFVILLVAATGPALINSFSLLQARSLVVAAASEERPSELRSTWSPYREFHVQRTKNAGEQDSILHRPKLSDAVSAVDKKQNSSDPRWIQIRGRVALLLRDKEAVQLLAKAAQLGLNDPGTEIDLAAAYFQRDMEKFRRDIEKKDPAQDGKNVPDLNDTIDLLTKVLKDQATTPEEAAVAWFDLAIAHEKMLSWDQAVPAWEKYLALDSAGPWRAEAQQHLEAARKNLQPSKPQGYREPAFFLFHSSDPAVKEDVEGYQEIALRSWLPEAMDHRSAESFRALRQLAGLLKEEHQDPWMADFLNAIALRPGDEPAVHDLGQAITSNQHGFPTQAKAQAERAARRFVASGNLPGALRARYESVYANQRLLEQKSCLKTAQELEKELRSTQYGWLQAQIALEQAACHFAETNSPAFKNDLERGGSLAEKHRFHILSLRVLAFESASSCKDAGGLQEYWKGPRAPARLYEFHAMARDCLEGRRLWHAVEALEQRMIEILEKEIDSEDANQILAVAAHRALAGIQKKLGEDDAAEEQTRQAILLLDGVPDEAASRKYELPTKLDLADLQLDRGDIESALTTAEQARELLLSIDNDEMLLNFHRVRGDIQRKRQQLGEAETEYKAGIEIAERSLRRLTKESDRFEWTKGMGNIYRGLVGVFIDQKKPQEALQLWEWYQSRSRLETGPARQSDDSWPEIEEMVLKTPVPVSTASTSRLVYAKTKDRLYIWTIGKLGIKIVSVPDERGKLEDMILEYSLQCSTKDSEMTVLDAEGKRLFALLLEPVTGELRGSDTVVVELDPALKGLLLETLKSPEGWYFGQKYPVIYSPGFVAENALKAARKQPESGVLLDAGALLLNERDDIIHLFPAIIPINGADTTAAELPQMLESSEVFVFIGHGVPGALMLNDKEKLTPESFQRKLLRHLQLAVLAACSTGSAQDGLTDTGNLAHAFVAGGTPTVIASQWDVDSDATRDLMKSFFEHLKMSESVPRALLEARRYVYSGRSHPYYWAGFSVIGRAS